MSYIDDAQIYVDIFYFLVGMGLIEFIYYLVTD